MTTIFSTYYDFLNRQNKDDNGVSKQFAEQYPDFEKQNETNKGCWNCSRCSDCSDCSGLRAERDAKNEQEAGFVDCLCNSLVNVLDDGDDKAPGHELKMDSWHVCDTTHCRAGWVVHLAGEAGYKLERKTSTLFAAQQIYKKSSPIQVSPPRFFESNKIALSDIERCADEEVKSQNN